MSSIGALKDVVNALTAPEIFISVAAIVFLIALRSRWLWRGRPAAIMGLLAVAFLGVSMLDPNFALIVKKPDNVPIVAMLFLVGFFVWLSLSQAYTNDDRIAASRNDWSRARASAAASRSATLPSESSTSVTTTGGAAAVGSDARNRSASSVATRSVPVVTLSSGPTVTHATATSSPRTRRARSSISPS